MSGKKFGYRTTALEVVEGHNLKGYEVIVTGAASGIGVETARAFAHAGARVIIAARDLSKAQSVADDIVKSSGNHHVEVEQLDLASLKSVRAFISRFTAKNRPLHILVNNAGIMACPLSYTEDGFESQFGTNHMGHFALTVGLLSALKEGAKQSGRNSRVVSVSSIAHGRSDIDFNDVNFKNREYNEWVSYGQSKTANALLAVALTKRYLKDGIVSNSVMPGGIMTGLQKNMTKEDMIKRGWMDENGKINEGFKTIEQGASTSVWAALAPEFENNGGHYLENCAISEVKTVPEIFQTMNGVAAYALNPESADRLWEVSEKLLAEASH